MRYYNAVFCVNCKKELTIRQEAYSNGRCPLCGYKHPFACTVVKTFDRGYKLVKINPIWKFWKSRYKRVYVEDKD